MLSTLVCWAFMPLAAVYSARIIVCPFDYSSDARDLLDRLRIHVAADPDGLLQHFKLAHYADETHGAFGHRHIGFLDLPLLHFNAIGGGWRLRRIAILEAGVADLL